MPNAAIPITKEAMAILANELSDSPVVEPVEARVQQPQQPGCIEQRRNRRPEREAADSRARAPARRSESALTATEAMLICTGVRLSPSA